MLVLRLFNLKRVDSERLHKLPNVPGLLVYAQRANKILKSKVLWSK